MLNVLIVFTANDAKPAGPGPDLQKKFQKGKKDKGYRF